MQIVKQSKVPECVNHFSLYKLMPICFCADGFDKCGGYFGSKELCVAFLGDNGSAQS